MLPLLKPTANLYVCGDWKSSAAVQRVLDRHTAESTRAAGDAIQSIIEDHFAEILGDLVGEYSASFARRAMADLAFNDAVNNYLVVDVKTHREGATFNMPNLTSVDRLARFHEDDTNYFVMLM